jgi:hypothetical protein
MRDSIQNLAMTAPPAEEPISLTTAKLHLRVTIANDDPLISALITAARELCEKETHRSFVTRDYELRLDRFPPTFAMQYLPAYSDERSPGGTYGMIRLPKPPLVGINTLSYYDQDGTLQLLSPSQYSVDAGGVLQGAITPAYGYYWPNARYQLDAILIGYTAGYGPAAAVPASIAQAMLLCIGHWYRNRESVTPTAFTELPMGSKALLSSFKWGSYG